MRRSRSEIASALIRNHGVVGLAARDLGISPRNLSRRINSSDYLQHERVAIAEQTYEQMFKAVMALALSGHWPALRWGLDTFARDRGYGVRRSTIELASPEATARLEGQFNELVAAAYIASQP